MLWSDVLLIWAHVAFCPVHEPWFPIVPSQIVFQISNEQTMIRVLHILVTT